MKRLENKVVVVTGGSLGIGAACCKRMAEEGARIAITDILDKEGRELSDEINANGGNSGFWLMDVSDEKSVKEVFSQIRSEFGKIDVLVNNAGISGVNKPTDQIELKDWQKVMNINVTGVFLCTKHVIPYMRENGEGSIINLSSIYGIIGAADIPPYHASKGAVRLMTKNDALIYASEKIRVNSVHPGFIWTPLVEHMAQDSGEEVSEFRKKLNAQHPVGHVGEPDDIAYGVIYLASDESRFVVGSELVIDGGYISK
jgi:NAD(P)-dependent dehydrogenase (short-subunit alcohol dehydrogenase family)